jgi:hypothetical protein
MGSLCGYVGVPPDHPFYLRHYDHCPVEVHGGLTYSGLCRGSICHKPEPGEERDIWWLGFDCAHYQDLVPSMRLILGHLPSFTPLHIGDRYRSIGYVWTEVSRLAEQVAGAV